MKKLLLLPLLFTSTYALSQESADKFRTEISAGYTLNNLGESYHMLLGRGNSRHLFYGGMRVQEHSFYNLSSPTDGEVYRYDAGGKPLGFIVGYQRKVTLPNSAIIPFAFFDFEYAYLNSIEQVINISMQPGTEEVHISANPPRSLLLPAVGLGFEAQIYKQLHIRQFIGGTAFFDPQARGDMVGPSQPLTSFNGIGYSLRLSLLYRFK